jgi:tetratricopeptide (TPR) repeat protein
MWRDFVGAERHIDLARRMNPNDATIQLFWAWVQSCLGHPERSLPATEIALRLNPCHPTWYNFILAQVLFSLARYEEAAAHLERLVSATPARHSRNMAWRAAAYGHSGDLSGAFRCAGIFVDGFRDVWRGDPSAGPREYVNWLVDVAHLKRAEDEQRLREGLRLAGLPA